MKRTTLILIALYAVVGCGGGTTPVASSPSTINAPAASTTSPTVDDRNTTDSFLSKASPVIIKNAETGTPQYVWVEYFVHSNLSRIWEEYKAQEKAKGVFFTRERFWQSPAYKELIQEYAATREEIFPNNRLGSTVVETIYFEAPAVLVQVFDMPSLMQIVSHAKVKQAHVPGEYDWDRPQVEDEQCLPPYPLCVRLQ